MLSAPAFGPVWLVGRAFGRMGTVPGMAMPQFPAALSLFGTFAVSFANMRDIDDLIRFSFAARPFSSARWFSPRCASIWRSVSFCRCASSPARSCGTGQRLVGVAACATALYPGNEGVIGVRLLDRLNWVGHGGQMTEARSGGSFWQPGE